MLLLLLALVYSDGAAAGWCGGAGRGGLRLQRAGALALSDVTLQGKIRKGGSGGVPEH